MKIDTTSYAVPVFQMPVEMVEIKGRGHPDTICDLLCENVSFDLMELYTAEFGRPLHYNIDKALLVGGSSEPQFGGGRITSSPRLYIGDRAQNSFEGKTIDLNEPIKKSAQRWISENLRCSQHGLEFMIINEVKSGSTALNSVESRAVSNDTSVGVGSWPLSPLENVVLGLEKYLNSAEFKELHPEAGEDIKIMSLRNERSVDIICAMAMIDRHISSVDDYISKKQAVLNAIENYLSSSNSEFAFNVRINSLDDYEHKEAGLYLTVSGLSCEDGDSGQVGRGNRVNGLISFLRPQTMEAWAGKNPTSHVGKIYSFAAQALARKLCISIPKILEANVFILGEIGSPVQKPKHIFCTFAAQDALPDMGLRDDARKVIEREIEAADIFRIENLKRKS